MLSVFFRATHILLVASIDKPLQFFGEKKTSIHGLVTDGGVEK